MADRKEGEGGRGRKWGGKKRGGEDNE